MLNRKLPLRFNKYWREEPKKPLCDSPKFRIEYLAGCSERYNHFRNTANEDYELEDEDNPELTGKLDDRQSLSLKEVNEMVRKEGLDESKVFFTASFQDDYLSLEVVNIKELGAKEQLEEYEDQHAAWKKQEQDRHDYEVKRIEREMQHLQQQAERLKKKT
jgi:hypothetical protein